MATIAIIDYGMGNLRSVAKALERVSKARVELCADPHRLRQADRIVFPGQGAIRDCMQALQQQELAAVIVELAQTKPFLGICIGLQALLRQSAESGGVAGLGMYAGEVRHLQELLPPGAALKIPHVGWNRVRQTQAHPLWRGIADDSRFYFVHSYYATLEDAALTAGVASYGSAFTAALAQGNVFATQFHPEKSQQAGLELLANFARWDGGA